MARENPSHFSSPATLRESRRECHTTHHSAPRTPVSLFSRQTKSPFDLEKIPVVWPNQWFGSKFGPNPKLSFQWYVMRETLC